MTTTTPEPPALDSDVEDDLDEAFTADSWIAEEDPPEALSNLLPPRPDTHLEELEEEVRSRRVLILRQGAVIAVSTLLAIGGALLIHFFLGGVFILGLLFGSTPARETERAHRHPWRQRTDRIAPRS